jgi:hypothetical protein
MDSLNLYMDSLIKDKPNIFNNHFRTNKMDVSKTNMGKFSIKDNQFKDKPK